MSLCFCLSVQTPRQRKSACSHYQENHWGAFEVLIGKKRSVVVFMEHARWNDEGSEGRDQANVSQLEEKNISLLKDRRQF